MKKGLSMILSILLCFLMIMTPMLNVQAIEKEEYILNDAFVSNFNGQSNNNMVSTGNTEKLIFGKGRHVYIRLDLSKISFEEANNSILNISKTHGENTILISQASEYLINTNGEESDILWNENNITYNNRPSDINDSPIFSESLGYGNIDVKLNISELLVDAKNDGKDKITLHITTEKVENSTISASEMYSTRSNNSPYIEFVEEPTQIERTKNLDNYLDNASVAQKIFKLKDTNNNYVKLNEDNESFTTTLNYDEASTFALYIYDYKNYPEEEYGATVTTYSIKCLDNNKYLTFQNYFDENDENKQYFNLVDQASNTYEIKATASETGWNERFYLKYYEKNGYYTIATHLRSGRDGGVTENYPIAINSDMMYSKVDSLEEYNFIFEDVEGAEELEVRQDVSGSNLELFWYPINGDVNIDNYQVKNASIIYENGLMHAYFNSLSVGDHTFEVNYNNKIYTKTTKVDVSIFSHPGIGHTEEELNLMKEHIDNKQEPWYSDYQKLVNTVPYNMSNTDYIPTFFEEIGRGNPSGHGNIGYYEQSANAAYFNALQWVITGDSAFADKVVEILNGWSNLKILDGRDRILGAAISTYKLNNAAEIIKYYNGGYSAYSDSDFEKYQSMVENVIYPVIQDLGVPMTANGNWDIAAMLSMISIGVLCDNTEIFDRAVSLYQDIHVNGSIATYVSEWGQTAESGRDQAHAQLGVGYMADICQVALNQNINLYELYDNRLAKAFEWSAKYNLYNDDVKFEPLPNVFGRTDEWSYWTKLDEQTINRGELRPIYELPLSYYSTVQGVDVTWMQKAAEAMRPQGYVHNDNLNFGTLTSYNGEPTEVSQPYFQLRTKLTPWYQRTWSEVEKYRDENSTALAETLNSYFDVTEDGELQASTIKSSAPFFQLINNQDGTYSIRCTKNNRYLSVKDEVIGNQNVIKVDAETIGENEKFIFFGYYLSSPSHNNRKVTVNIEGSKEDPKNAILTIRLGENSNINSAAAEESFAVIYNTEELALSTVELADITELEELINKLYLTNNNDNKYTEESFKIFEDALELANEGIIGAKEAKIFQEEVDKLVYNLNEAYNGLVENKTEDDSDDEVVPDDKPIDTEIPDSEKENVEVKPDNGNQNKPQTNLPKTGGTNTIIIIIVALVVLVSGTTLLLKNNQNKKAL